MNLSNHLAVKQLQAFISGQLPPNEAILVERHLEHCDSCSQLLSTVSASSDPLVERLRGLAQPSGAAEGINRNETPGRRLTKEGMHNAVTDGNGTAPQTPMDACIDQTCIPATDTPPTAENTNSNIAQRTMGRYRIERLLGRGGFGEVYRAWDDELQRWIAIKVTFLRFLSSDAKDSYLAEARAVASLDHPHIVPVYDVGQAENGDYFVVSKLIDGSDLSQRIKAGRLSHIEIISVVRSIAEALQHAHSKGLVHRDVKPANILVDKSGVAFLADFGIALREESFGRGEGLAGTPNYMSPEQARGEGHRVDGRSDIYSLGVVLYELLTSQRPFQSFTSVDLLKLIAENEVRPPRQIDNRISRDFERICLKSLALRASDRYSTASDFAEDLRCLPEVIVRRRTSPDGTIQHAGDHLEAVSPPTPTGPTRVVPKGLSSYDQNDADFFLELLPGPIDRHGLPDSIRFWKQRIECKDSEFGFSVGLIYGPSGCGKSSLMKAGILPRLSQDVVAVYVEAAGDMTEQRLASAIQKKLPSLAGDRSLKDTLTAIRRGQGLPAGKRLLIVIDQFEQWLHGIGDYRSTEMTAALRQCDGQQIRCVLLVRDDFWLALSRFMKELEIDIDASNSRLADLFDIDHASRVLSLFGKAFGRLPDSSAAWSEDQQTFVKTAVAGLAQDRRVVSVRLALFAQMVRDKAWTPATLKDIGGTSGVGITFLEETFSSRTSQPKHRRHGEAARAVLRHLLPELGTDIKGHMRSQQELLEVSSYSNRPNDFTELLRILDGELRLITPADPDGDSASGFSRDSSLATRYYQLTHDYLVPSLREWLSSKQKETRKGRAELKLEERAALWYAKPEDRHLPSLTEWLNIRWLTQSQRWTSPQRVMMKRAGKVHGVRTSITMIAVCLLVAAGLGWNQQANERRNQAEATRLVEGLLSANTTQVGKILESLKLFRNHADQQLQSAFHESAHPTDAKLHAALALLAEDRDVDRDVLRYVLERLLTVSPYQIAPVCESLKQHRSELSPEYWKIAKDTHQTARDRFRAACALAAFDQDSSEWSNPEFAYVVAEELVGSFWVEREMKDILRPIAPHLIPALSNIFKDATRGELKKTIVTTLLADYAAQDADTLTELVLVADPVSDKSLFPLLQQHRVAAVRNLESVLDQRLEPNWNDAPRDPVWIDPSPAMRARIESAHGLIAEHFAFCQDMPITEFLEVAEALRASGYRPTRVRPHLPLLPLAGGEGGRRPDEGGVKPATESAIQIAAIWTRDGRLWHLDSSLTKPELPLPDAPAAVNNLLLTDIAPLPLTDDETELQLIAVWSAPGMVDEQRRVLLDVTEAELTAAEKTLREQGFISQCSIAVRTSSIGQRRYTAIWSNRGASSELRPAYAGFELVHQPQWDVAVAPAAKLIDPLDVYRQQLTQIEKLPAEKLDEPQIRQARAAALYHLGNLEAALIDLDFLTDKEIVTANVLRYRTLTLARLGKAEEARESLQKHLATDAPATLKLYVQIQVPAWLGDFDQSSTDLETAAASTGQNNAYLYTVASAAALCSQALSGKDAVRSQKFADRTLELLRQMMAQGYKNANQLKSDADFASLHGDPRFLELLSQLEPPTTWAGLWRADIEYESKLLTAVPITSVAEQLKPLLGEDWRPFAIAVDSSGGACAVVASLPTEPLCSVVLHRPLIPDSEKESLALHQAAAATALLRLNASANVWPLFQDQPDPRLRSYLLHRVAKYSVDPQSLINQLNSDPDASRRRSLILGLGEFSQAKLLTPAQESALIADLAKRYADDPDPGVHGAAEWTLRQLGAQAKIAEVQAAYATGEVVGDRRWYLIKRESKSLGMSPMAFAIVQPKEQFLMGSPVYEAERIQGPTGSAEFRHRRRIGRSFAIGMHEITVAQFSAFRSDHKFDRAVAEDEESPANYVTWYSAAEYCNWLSKEEGFPQDQWCYYSDEPFNDGMRLPPDYLQRIGYRLLSEAEWEYACRAGTTTSRYFGETETLLGEFAWCSKTSREQSMLPVATLRPNAIGLFDMQGNAAEWCQEAGMSYEAHLAITGDEEQRSKLSDSQYRVARGGSTATEPSHVRSASRLAQRPDTRGAHTGFRVGRTLPHVP